MSASDEYNERALEGAHSMHCHTSRPEESPCCGVELKCTCCYAGGGSHYWMLKCEKCGMRYGYDTHAFELYRTKELNETPRTEAATYDDFTPGTACVDTEACEAIERDLNESLVTMKDAAALYGELATSAARKGDEQACLQWGKRADEMSRKIAKLSGSGEAPNRNTCPFSFPHPPHDYCDGSPMHERQPAAAEMIESSPDWQRARMLGRREALNIILEQNAEDFPDEFQRSCPIGDTGDFRAEWKEDKLAKLLDAEEPSSLIERLDDLSWKQAAEISELRRERDEAHAELAAMREAVAVTTALAEWSARYPRGVIYSASNRQMDAELIELEERAKAAMAKLQPFLK